MRSARASRTGKIRAQAKCTRITCECNRLCDRNAKGPARAGPCDLQALLCKLCNVSASSAARVTARTQTPNAYRACLRGLLAELRDLGREPRHSAARMVL